MVCADVIPEGCCTSITGTTETHMADSATRADHAARCFCGDTWADVANSTPTTGFDVVFL